MREKCHNHNDYVTVTFSKENTERKKESVAKFSVQR